MLKRCLILRTIGSQHKYYTRPALIAPIGDKLLLPSLSCKCLRLGNIYDFNILTPLKKTQPWEITRTYDTLALRLFCIDLIRAK